MCILIYVKLIQCSGIPQIYGQLEEGGLVYVHSAICETYLVQWYSIELWSIGGGTSAINICAFCYMLKLFHIVVFYRYKVNWGKGPWYTCILLYAKHIWCSGIPQIYGQLEEGTLEYVHSTICETYLVQLYSIHLSLIGWGYICHMYMCILLYVKLIWCSCIPQMYSQLEERGLSICAFCYM